MARIIDPRPVSAEEQVRIEYENALIGRFTGAVQVELASVLSDPAIDSLKITALLRILIDRGAVTRDEVMAMDAGQLHSILTNAIPEVFRDGADAMAELAVEDPEFSETWDAFWAGLPDITAEMCERVLANIRAAA